jgi:hypothetical protein
LLAAVLLAVAAPIGLAPVAIAICLSLTLPAVAFNIRSARDFGLGRPLAPRRTRWSLAVFATTQVAIPLTLIVVIESAVSSWQLLGIVVAAALACLALSILFLARRARPYWWGLLSPGAASCSAAAVDHFARK